MGATYDKLRTPLLKYRFKVGQWANWMYTVACDALLWAMVTTRPTEEAAPGLVEGLELSK